MAFPECWADFVSSQLAIGSSVEASQRSPAKAGGLPLRLKAGSIGRSADLQHIEVIFLLRWLLIFDVLLPHLVGHVAARRDPVAPSP